MRFFRSLEVLWLWLDPSRPPPTIPIHCATFGTCFAHGSALSVSLSAAWSSHVLVLVRSFVDILRVTWPPPCPRSRLGTIAETVDAFKGFRGEAMCDPSCRCCCIPHHAAGDVKAVSTHVSRRGHRCQRSSTCGLQTDADADAREPEVDLDDPRVARTPPPPPPVSR